MTVLLIAFMCVALVLAAKCVAVQGLDLADNANEALMLDPQQLPATRGTITDRNGQVLAESVPAVNITTDPTIVSTNGLAVDAMGMRDKLKAQAGPGLIAGILTAYLGGDFQTYYSKLTTTANDSGDEIHYAMLARNVLTYNNIPLTQALDNLGYVGLYREQAPVRNYPNGALASNVLGFMTYSDELEAQDKYPWTGGDGLEYALNTTLSGVDGQEVYETSPYGKIPTGTSIVKAPQEGISYQLTLDLGLQYMQDQRLAAAVASSGARSGMAITMTVDGEILAASSYPTFDSNDPAHADPATLGEPIVRTTYEPGSVEKVLTFAALVDQGLVSPDTRVIVPGKIASGDSLIGDAWAHDTLHLTAAGVVANSSNVGTVVLTRQISKDTLVSYLENFGLGSPTGVGLPGEESGSLPGADMSDMTRDNISFGQGLSVTALQEATAVAAVVNGGVYHSPTLIKSATDGNGRPVDVPAPTVRRVISQDTANQVVSMMESVVQLNRGSFDIPGYNTAGKSGTAEAVDPSCGCYSGSVMSYVGVAPAENPYLLTYVVLDHPVGNTSGTLVAAPVVRDVMSVALPRYGVPTSTTDVADLPLQW
ncbi:MAG: penicillin-binding protein 2 [Propionibacteriaceae bacterium]|nr:penicillin-binding protein 2 [Propionibacteriaceae bacterium]